VEGHVVTVAPHGISFTAREEDTILTAARRAGVWMPFECGWGSCGTCKVTLVSGATRCLFDDAPALHRRDRARSRILACQSCATSDVVIETRGALGRRDDLPTDDYRGVCVANELIGPDIRLMRFALDRPADFLPGQYAMLVPAGGPRRAYSMTSLPGAHEVEFLVRRFPGGAATERLFELAEGAMLDLEMPFGAAYHRPTPRPAVFVAGGTGLAPVLSMLRALAAAGGGDAPAPPVVLYGARSVEELVLLGEVRALCAALGGELVAVAERPGDGWSGESGFVTDAMARVLDGDWRERTWYMAGPPPMIGAAMSALHERSVQLTRIHYDSFG
jgi:toluene monooxygenase electron transfer component